MSKGHKLNLDPACAFVIVCNFITYNSVTNEDKADTYILSMLR